LTVSHSMGMLRFVCFLAASSTAQWYWEWKMAESIVIVCLVAAALAGKGHFSCSSPVCEEKRDGDALSVVAASKCEGMGSRKHCGLRLDPMDSSIPVASYSLVPLQLPLPDLNEKQRAALKELETRVEDLSSIYRTDPGTLVRFMRARKFDVDASETYFREAMKWWEKNDIKEVLTTWNLEAYEQCFAPWYLSGGFMGHGREGEAIAYQRLSKCNWPKWVQTFPRQHIKKLDIVHCLRSLAAVEEDSLRTGKPLGHGILVEDCHGFGFDQASFASAVALNKLIRARNYLMPECLSKILVVNAPRAWVYAWGIFSWILDDGVKAKVQIARPGSQTIALLRKYISDEEIPACLGGSKHIDGDPECGRILAPGGFPPESAFTNFFKLVAKDEMDMCEMNMCRQGSTDSQESLVSQAAGVPQPEPEPELEEDSGRGCMSCCVFGKHKA